MSEKLCQSDGAPMDFYEYGTEADGSKSTDYCSVCYNNGAFTNPNCTLEEMIETTADIMVKQFGFSPEEAMKQCKEGIPTLKRWQTA